MVGLKKRHIKKMLKTGAKADEHRLLIFGLI